MKLKKLLTTLDGVDEKYHDLYEKQADGKFHLAVEDDDTAALKSAKDHEKAQRKLVETQLKEVQDKLDAAEAAKKKKKDDDARSTGDVEALEKSWQEKFDKQKADNAAETARLTKALQGEKVEGVAQAMATKLAGKNALLILPHIERRLKVEIGTDGAKTRVLDAAGVPSALTVKELEEEFFTNPLFESIILGSEANGSGANGGQNSGAGKKKFSDASPAEKVTYKKKNGSEAYQRWRDAGKKS
jgi:hypothetical protein